ncbi:MAG: YciI family protein, partial [Gammaproteobacteria bacterium]
MKGKTMQYMCLIYENEQSGPEANKPDMPTLMAEYQAFGQAVNEGGVYVSGEPLQPIATATTVRVRDGQTQTTDGPFAETKEQLGGFYLLECKDLD